MMQSIKGMMETMMQTFVSKIEKDLAPLKKTVRSLKEAQDFSEQLEHSAEGHANKFARVDGGMDGDEF